MSTIKRLSRAASERIGYEGVTEDEVVEAAREALVRPQDAAFWDDTLFHTHTLLGSIAYAPNSDDILAESNYRTVFAALIGEFPDGDKVTEESVGHWTYSSFNVIRVRVINGKGHVTPEFAVAYTYAKYLRDEYPVFDDSDYSNLEYEYWNEAFDSEFEWLTRDVDVSDDDKSRIAEYLNEHYYGDWVNPEWITEAGAKLGIRLTEDDPDYSQPEHAPQLHQDVRLFGEELG